jgi:hypothetical protein
MRARESERRGRDETNERERRERREREGVIYLSFSLLVLK